MLRKPLIHYITHPIVMTDCANAILAVGGSPIMAEHHAEVAAITAKAAALVVNLGNITDYRMQAMRLSAQVALAKGLPIVLDLTGLGVSALRRRFARDFIATFSPQLIKGNVSEMLALLAFATQANGVDTGDHHLSLEQLTALRDFCQAHDCVSLVTGEIDVIADAERFICLRNGSEKLTQVTGTGCLLSGLLGYFLSQVSVLEPAEMIEATVKAVGLLTVASEVAEENATGLGSFKVALFDGLGNLTLEQVQEKIRRFESQAAQLIVDFREENRIMTPSDLKLYLVTNRGTLTNQAFLTQIEQAILGGVTCVQLREKDATSQDFYYLALQVKALTDRYEIPFLINDRLDIALAVDASGVHLGQSDLPVTVAKQLLGPDKVIGISAKTVDQALAAQAGGADYLGVGAMFPTKTKVITQETTRETLMAITETVQLPVVAIGGISKVNCHQLVGTGIAGLAVVSAIMSSDHPRSVAADLSQMPF